MYAGAPGDSGVLEPALEQVPDALVAIGLGGGSPRPVVSFSGPLAVGYLHRQDGLRAEVCTGRDPQHFRQASLAEVPRGLAPAWPMELVGNLLGRQRWAGRLGELDRSPKRFSAGLFLGRECARGACPQPGP